MWSTSFPNQLARPDRRSKLGREKGRKVHVGATPLYGALPHAVGNIELQRRRACSRYRLSEFAGAHFLGGMVTCLQAVWPSAFDTLHP